MVGTYRIIVKNTIISSASCKFWEQNPLKSLMNELIKYLSIIPSTVPTLIDQTDVESYSV